MFAVPCVPMSGWVRARRDVWLYDHAGRSLRRVRGKEWSKWCRTTRERQWNRVGSDDHGSLLHLETIRTRGVDAWKWEGRQAMKTGAQGTRRRSRWRVKEKTGKKRPMAIRRPGKQFSLSLSHAHARTHTHTHTHSFTRLFWLCFTRSYLSNSREVKLHGPLTYLNYFHVTRRKISRGPSNEY